MLFNSGNFLLFFPIVVLIYYCIPHKIRIYWLLVCSYFFYMCWNVNYALLLLASTAITYACGLLIQRVRDRGKQKVGLTKILVGVSFALNLSMLFFFKYFDFVVENLQKIFNILHIQISTPTLDILLPVGISFYIFQALGYTMDVYRNEIPAERNFIKYAVFVSFFPQLVAGPIERSKSLLRQFEEKHIFCVEKVRDNLLLMGYGYFLKMVVADRAAIFVDAVYGNYQIYGGWYIVVASVLFAFQIYCDFAGYSTIAIGAAGVMGFDLMENFKAPYCALSVRSFWERWHISLTSWFRDYLYIPLGGNRHGKVRKYCNKLIVFLVSGLWHGARWSFVVWGGLNGLYVIIGELTLPLRDKVKQKIGWKQEAISNKVVEALISFVLVNIAWIFFRAPGTKDAINMLNSIWTTKNIGIFFDQSLYRLGLDQRNFILLLIAICVILLVDILHTRNIHVRAWVLTQNTWFRWSVYILLIISIVVLGVWGANYNVSSFIYFQF